MSKPDYPPLWPPGRHRISLKDFRAIAVERFPRDGRRRELYLRLETWITRLQALGVKATLWLDGSFTTEKPCPHDVDCILWNPRVDGEMTEATKQLLGPLVDKDHVDNEFGLDFFIEGPWSGDRFQREAYWSGVFGFGHDRITAKGFVEIAL